LSDSPWSAIFSRSGAIVVLATAIACSDPRPDPQPIFVRARFDPEANVIPLPSDLLRDKASGRLEIPVDNLKLSPAERELYGFFATLDGWPSGVPATVEFTGPVDPATLDARGVQIWKWGDPPVTVPDLTVEASADGKTVTIEPPEAGWERGARYVAMVRGGPRGVLGKFGEAVECDAAFYFARQSQRIDTPEHRALFPGATAEEKAENAARLEEVRSDLAPAFDYFAAQGTPRSEIAALWAFTITGQTELAIDAATQRVPFPSSLLLDPATGRVDIPDAPGDSAAELQVKQSLRGVDGFALSGSLLFEFSGAMDPASLTPDTVRLYQSTSAGPMLVPADVALFDDGLHVRVTPRRQPLAERTTFAVAVSRGVRDAKGAAVVPMPAAFLLTARSPLFEGGKSTLGSVTDGDAARLEKVRAELAPILDALGRETLIAAWPFTTMSVYPHLMKLAATPETLAVSPDPARVRPSDWFEALGEFPLSITTFGYVNEIYYGTIDSPQFLDVKTRANASDGSHRVEPIPFIATVPDEKPDGPLPVAIFAHAIGAERRFLLAIGDALAAEGFVGLAIDLPYHGQRSVCVQGGASLAVDPFTGEIVPVESCQPGATCNEEGRCVGSSGEGNRLATWEVVDTPLASGDAFFEFDHMERTRDHIEQAIVDLSALERSLRKGNWQAVLGRPVDPNRIVFAGESLGSIIGSSWLSVAESVPRAVLNVPAAGLVDVLLGSALFREEVKRFFDSEGIVAGSFEHERAVNVARWLVDPVDPQTTAERSKQRALLLQRARQDSIIPDWSAQRLADLTMAPLRDYDGDHLFLVLPIEDDFERGGRELARFLAGDLLP
jgi:hypothetical protein